MSLMKIAIMSKNNNFMSNIFEELKRRGHELVHYALDNNNDGLLTGDEILDRARFCRYLDKCDAVYVEFIEDLALNAAVWKYLNKLDIPLIMRLHRIELYEPFLHRIPWQVVNDLIFVAPQCMRKFQSMTKTKPQRVHLIPNGYDSNLFLDKKFGIYGKKMLMAGNIYWKKGIYEMIEFMSTMPKEWHLSIFGEVGRQDGNEYMVNCIDAINNRKVGDRVTIDKKVERQYLADIIFPQHDVIISASLEEGTHCTIAEGMLAGLYPLVRHWDGADEMYPPECVWDNFEQLKEKLMWWDALSLREKKAAGVHFRDWVVKRYDYRTQAMKVADVIERAML